MQIPEHITGLNENEVLENRLAFGSNNMEVKEDRVFWNVLREVVSEPMFILLVASCIIYFSLGQIKEGFIMLGSILLVSGISIYQEFRSRNAILSLKKISAPHVKVLRNGKLISIQTEEIVVNDIVYVEEGDVVSADGKIIFSNDFSLNESILTGESFPVEKNKESHPEVFRGTLVVSGSAYIATEAVGLATMFGKIGLSLQQVEVEKTPLQKQIKSFVQYMVWVGGIAFLVIVGVNYFKTSDLIQSILQGLTLAMSILPEEIPVAFSTFQALGAFRLLRNNHIIVKQPQYVETLGSATVICADKTGTITQNKMRLDFIFSFKNNQSIDVINEGIKDNEVLTYGMWSSEINPFDPMEIAIHELYKKSTTQDERHFFKQVHEYPLGGKPPMMTHIFSSPTNEMIIAMKGGPEAMLLQSILPESEKELVREQVHQYAAMGLRVLGVGKSKWSENKWPENQHEFPIEFLGLMAFQDPPKDNITQTLQTFYKAGIDVKMITGDYPETAMAIAKQISFAHDNEVLTGDEVLKMDMPTLREKVKTITLFARMFPEAKLKVIQALKENGEVVAMTGDGVNDGPALKAAHIGIAMGKRGSELAKATAALILTDDDLWNMTDAVAMGRKIYDNLKKAIQYIVSIHIPIFLIVALPLFFKWDFTTIFTPIHVIFLELIMGPTCSIVYENEPIEPGTMLRKPLKTTATFLSFRQLIMSIAQGLFISAGCLGIGYYFMNTDANNELIRSVIFITLLFSNIFLTLFNRSTTQSIIHTIRYKNRLVPIVLIISLAFIFIVTKFPFAHSIFNLSDLNLNQWILCILVAFVSTSWVEIHRFFLRRRLRSR